MYQIVKLPIPSAKTRRGPKGKYPWAAMQVGESFVVPAADVAYASMKRASNFQSKDGKQFRVALLDQSYQIWREA